MLNRKKRALLITSVCTVLTLLLGCVAPQQADQISILDRKQTQGEALVKTLQANNCTGSTEMKQDMQAVHQYTHDIQVTANAGVTVNKRAVADEIRSYYGLNEDQSDAVCVVPVQIPAGAYYTYDLEWVEVWREGVFELGKPDGDEEGTYRVRTSMLCEVVAQRAETCPSQ